MKVGDYATRNVIAVSPSDPIDHAINEMETHGFHHLLVVLHDSVVGMLSDRDILISIGWMLNVERSAPRCCGGTTVVGPTRIEQIMKRPVIWLGAGESCRYAAALMLKNKIGAIPIIDHGRLIGLMTETDLMRWLDAMAAHQPAVDRLLRCPVRQKMRPEPITVDVDAPLDDVVGLFRSHRVRHLPVMDGPTLTGMVSDRDVRRALGWAYVRDSQAEECGGPPPAEPQRAGQLMQSPVVTIAPDKTVREAMRLMLERGIHSLAVVEADRLVGIITQTDLVRAIVVDNLL